MQHSLPPLLVSTSFGAAILLATLVVPAQQDTLVSARPDGAMASPLASLATLTHDRIGSSTVTTIAVYGDAPYGTTPTDTTQLDATPAFIESINAEPDVDLVIHVGDIHSGKQYCTEAYDRALYAMWTQFQAPLVYTPGDNEWSDCHKVAQGGGAYNPATGQIDYVLDSSGAPVSYAQGDPVANLDLIRSIYFSRPGHAIGGSKHMLSQGFIFDSRHPSDSKYVENVLWAESRVVFVTVNTPGGSNNDQDIWYGAPTETATQAQERTERTGAALRWLDLAFGAARLAARQGRGAHSTSRHVGSREGCRAPGGLRTDRQCHCSTRASILRCRPDAQR